MTDKIVALSTCASPEEAEKLARLLLDGQLAACVSVIPAVRSFYHWNGAIESASECLLLVKTSRHLFPKLCETLGKAHSYELPETLAVPVVAGSLAYLEWMEQHLRKEPES